MSHLVRVTDEKRVSLETIYVPPRTPFKVGVWGMTNDLKLVACKDGTFDQAKITAGASLQEAARTEIVEGTACQAAVLPPPPNKQLFVKQFTFTKEDFFRIELRNGIHVWDWIRVQCASKKPDNLKAPQAKGSGKLNVHVVWATREKPALNFLPHYITVASLLLEKHGYKLNVTGSSWSFESQLAHFADNGIICQDDFGNLDLLAKTMSKVPAYATGDKLLVVMGRARQTLQDYGPDKSLAGQTVTAKQGASKNFIVLNVDNASLDGATLVHEMGHAAGFCDHNFGDHKSVMSYGARRNTFEKGRIEDFNRAFFRTA